MILVELTVCLPSSQAVLRITDAGSIPRLYADAASRQPHRKASPTIDQLACDAKSRMCMRLLTTSVSLIPPSQVI
jgi:hypothetical protein